MSRIFFVIIIAGIFSCQPEKKEVEEKIEVIEVKPDLRRMPSYCKKEKYKILKVNDRYFVQYPGGSVFDSYSTAKEANDAIEEGVRISYDAWIESGGLMY